MTPLELIAQDENDMRWGIMNQGQRRLWGAWLLAVMALVAVAGAAWAQPREIRIAVSSGQLIQFPRAARSVFIADPSIADVQVPSKNSVIVFGRKPGQTTLLAIDEQDKLLASIQVQVGYNLADVSRLVRQDVPSAAIELTSTPTGVVLAGTVPDAATADKVNSSIKRYINEKDELVDNLQVSGGQQVNLRVRVAEVQRTVTKALGFNWAAITSPGSFAFGLSTGRNAFLGGQGAVPALVPGAPLPAVNTLINPASPVNGLGVPPYATFGNYTSNRANVNVLVDALAEEGLVTILAEPNLTATSGQRASFLAGGEFPIPIAQAGATGALPTITVEYKQFGVSLAFVPTVMSSDRISINVRPEVSELTSTGAVDISGFVIPALNVRRAETTIELGSGESFAIAGLIQNNASTDISKYPGLGDVPVLGTLFRSSNFQRQESELVIIVTPYIIRPVADIRALKTPVDGMAPASDVERIFMQRLTGPAKPGSDTALGVGGARLQGDAGFIVQ
jgi:pilus assembly protein CpaC